MRRFVDEVLFSEKNNVTYCYHKNYKLAKNVYIYSRNANSDYYAYLRTSNTGMVEYANIVSTLNKSQAFLEVLGNSLWFLDENGGKITRSEFQSKYPRMVDAISSLVRDIRFAKNGHGSVLRMIIWKSLIDTSELPITNGMCFYLFSKSNHRLIKFVNAELCDAQTLNIPKSTIISSMCINPYLLLERGYREVDSESFYKLAKILKVMNTSVGLVISNILSSQTITYESEDKKNAEDVDDIRCDFKIDDPRKTYNRKLYELISLYKGYDCAANIAIHKMKNIVHSFNFNNKEDVYLLILLHWCLKIKITESVISEVENLTENTRYVSLFLECARHYNVRFDNNHLFTKKELYTDFTRLRNSQ